jgi:cytochrome c-type biogenesis protein
MGALAGTVGRLLTEYKTVVNIITGIIVIFFGLNFLGVFRLNLFKGSAGLKKSELGFFPAFLFGVVFSIGWTPCVGAFLGSALLLAASRARVVEGVVMLLLYSLGLGIPFFISALLIDKLKGAFGFVKRNYKVINTVCGCLLVLVGILMATGMFGKLISLLS